MAKEEAAARKPRSVSRGGTFLSTARQIPHQDAGFQLADVFGYNFWLSKPDEFDGNFISPEMVKAFVDATGYRSRFGR